ncbi:MAG TPA: HTTM domain-containing protein [Ilumatobacter sp.]|nr:HTTM domain-containing protein [Ilumatobacter sp.]
MVEPVRPVVEPVVTFLDTPVSMRPLARLRVPVGLIAAWYLQRVFRDGLAGRTYHDVFHRPYLGWLPDLPPPMFTAVMGVGVAAALAMAAGLATRVTTKVTFAVVVYHLLLSATHVHHNRTYLAIVLGVLAVAPCERDAVGPAWPLWLLRVECSVVYAASGVSKLLDRDWVGGTVTWLRVVHQEAKVRGSVLPGWVADAVLDRGAHYVFAPGIVATELAIAFGPWFRRTRSWALGLAVVFHVLIELTSRVETFSYLAVAVILSIWLPADLRGRVAHYLRTKSTQVA